MARSIEKVELDEDMLASLIKKLYVERRKVKPLVNLTEPDWGILEWKEETH